MKSVKSINPNKSVIQKKNNMRKIFFILFLSIPVFSNAQTKSIDSLQQLLKTERKDTSRAMLLADLAYAYLYSKPDTALVLSQQALSISKKEGYTKGEAASLNRIGNVFLTTGNYPKALEAYLQSLKKSESIEDMAAIARVTGNIGTVYSAQGDYRQSIKYLFKALSLFKSLDIQSRIAVQLTGLGDTYEKLNMLDSAKYYTDQGYNLSVQIKYKNLIGIALNNLGNIYSKMGNPIAAMRNYRLGIPYLIEERDDASICETYLGMAKLFQQAGDADSCLYYAKRSLAIAQQDGFVDYVMAASNFLTNFYSSTHNVDSAFVYQSAAIAARDSLFSQDKQRAIQSLAFDEATRQQEIQDAKEEAQTQMRFNLLAGGLLALLVVAFLLFRNNRQKKKANVLLQKQKEEIDAKAKELAKQKTDVEQLEEIGKKITSSLSVEDIIGTVYNNVNSLMDAKVFGIGIYNEVSKRIDFPATYENGAVLPSYSNGIEDKNRLSATCFNEGKEIVMSNLDEQHKDYVQHIPTPVAGDQAVSLIYLPLMAKGKKLGVITVQSFQQNAYSDYHLYMLRNIAIYAAIALENASSYTQLNQSMLHLKETQKQLIQSEKMASLGELTAGIAHEIQNPLNFVNNFSEVSNELIEEMKEELEKGDIEEAKAIAEDVKQNLEKIVHHGKRADAIVKGMLQHSRTSTGQKEPTDINALTDEYLRLSYHGLRAKDKSFNATMKTDFDESIGKINVIPQDMGRVILNLFNNAFYAVAENKKQHPEKYEPTVSVSTKKLDGHINIHVKDNGNGMPQKVLDKIFQPFFTTKPTGEGTGLGLSLSYDIIKAHGGELKVETKENEGSEFVIQLPVV
jgi:signal transduction histidine kinase/tetratricopeptide (TPR) repeat protein